MKKITTFIFFFLFSIRLFSQTPINLPPFDSVWILDTAVSDDFNYTTDNYVFHLQNKWDIFYGGGNKGDHLGYHKDDGSNIYVNNGICSLAVKKEPGMYNFPCNSCWALDFPPYSDAPYNGKPIKKHYDYTETGLISKTSTKFGYYELKFRLPNYDKEQTSSKGIMPNFWFYDLIKGRCYPNNPYQEIDVFEVNTNKEYTFCPTVHYGGKNNAGPTQNDAWDLIGWGFNPKTNQMNWDAPLNFEIDFKDGKFHTIGFEWMPEHLTIYVDGIAIRSTNWKQDLMCSMNIILDIYAGSGFNGSPNENTIFPFYYEIDYIHYYKLKSTENKNYIYTNKSTYDEIAKHIYQSITISKESKPSLKSSKNSSLKKQNIKLRATEEIILDEGFETHDESETYIDVNNN